MAQYKTCPECGATLSPDTPEGLCPKCLLRPEILEDATEAMPQTPLADSERIRYFGDYELEGEIARGGMGVVYTARQVTLNRRVAVKMILAGHLADETTVKRFYAEAEAAANLNHPNIVSIHEVGYHNGQHYFSMDLVDGQNLAERMREQPYAVREAAAIVKTIAVAIHYAHQRGVLHRDLKPSNVLIDMEGRPLVTDFGLAKLTAGDSMLTHSGELMGTPSYMPPEQAAGHQDQVGPHSDVYSLGAILYELLTERPPFQSRSSIDALLQIMEVEPVAPRRSNTLVPPDLDTICLKCLEKLPAHRYATAAELADDLGRFLDHEPIHARPASLVRKLIAGTRRRPGQLAALASLVFSGLVGVLYYLVQENALLRAMQITPDLSREPGTRVEALVKWGFAASVVFYTGLFFTLWILKRIRTTPRHSADTDLAVRPFTLLGSRVRTMAATVGLLATLFSLAYGMKVIEAYVWEGGGKFQHFIISYGTAWFGLWLLVIVAADFRRSLFGAPQRTLTGEQKEAIERALLERDGGTAIRLYQQAFADAGRAEAHAFVLQRFDDMRRQNPQEFAAAAPRLWDLNWRRMALCALIELPIVAALLLAMRPESLLDAVLGWGMGGAFGFGVIFVSQLDGFRRRFFAILAVFIIQSGVAFAVQPSLGDLSEPSMFLGMVCGMVLMMSGLGHGRRPPNKL